MSLSKKIWLGFSLIIVIFMLLASISYYGLNTMKTITKANGLSQEFLLREIDHLNWANKLDQEVRGKMPLSIQKDHTQCAFGKWYYGNSRASIVSFFPSLKELIASIEEVHTGLHQTAHEIDDFLSQGNYEQATLVLETKTRSALKKIQSILGEIRKMIDQEVKKYGESSDTIVTNLLFAIVLGTFLTLLAGISIAYFTNRSIQGPVIMAIEVLSENSQQVSHYSEKIKESGQALNLSSQMQAASSQETSASVAQLEAISQRNSEHSESASDLSQQALASAQKGSLVLENLLSSLESSLNSGNKVLTEVEENKKELQSIISVIQEISHKITAINDIVFQTKLLSFNASVEAARAGESGKGFAVVADEVRKLAEMSGEVASSITDLVSNSTNHVENIIKTTSEKFFSLVEETQKKLKESSSVAVEAEQVFSQIRENSKKTADLVGEISTSNQEQRLGIGEISKAIHLIDESTNNNAEIVDSTAEISNKLSSKAVELENLVSSLQNIVYGEKKEHINHQDKQKKVEELGPQEESIAA